MRLDNSTPEIITFFGLPVLVDDLNPPVDVCLYCWEILANLHSFEIDHPNYEDDEYYCEYCGTQLTYGNNGQ